MKKITKIILTTAAVLAVLLAVSCSESPTLVEPGYKERNESYKDGYTHASAPSVTVTLPSTLNYNNTGRVLTESEKEISITFPAYADVLKETDAKMTEKLNEFLSFNFYTNPASIPSPFVYTPSTLGDKIKYTFVRRNLTSANIIYIAFTEGVPNIDKIVAKVDASKFKVYGQLTDSNLDGTSGESYDDQYQEITISGSTSYMMPNSYTNVFYRPEVTADITINGPLSGSFTNANTSQYISLYNTGNAGTGYLAAFYRSIRDDLKDKIVIEKYNKEKNEWEKDSAEIKTFNYDSVSGVPAEFPAWWSNTDQLYTVITPEDLGIYRVKATGLKKLVSKVNYGEGKPAKIFVTLSNDDLKTSLSNSYLFDTGYSSPALYQNTDTKRQWQTVSPVINYLITSDSNKKNVVIELYCRSIIDTKTNTVAYPEQLSLEDFKKSVKLVYKPSNVDYAGSLSDQKELVELKIKDVKYDNSKRYDVNQTEVNRIVVTLDPSFQLGSQSFYLLLSPGFKYTGGNIIFGDPSLNSFYNGSYFWKNYQAISSGSGIPGPIQLTASTWANGNIQSYGTVEYSFSVTQGTAYYVWWNDGSEGDSTKTLDISVSATYVNGGSVFNGDDNWFTPQMFTASQTGAVLLSVSGYGYGSSGTFAIVYATSNVRP